MSSLFRRVTSDKEYPEIKMVVFDFDGTLVDTRKLLLNIVKKHLLKFEISLTKDLLKFFGNTPLKHYLTLAGLSSDMVNAVFNGITKDFISECKKVKPCKNFYSLKKIDARKIILSNNVTHFILKCLKILNSNFFDEVYGSDKFKNNKSFQIKKLIKKYKLDPSQVIYVGDKDIDADVAKGAGCYGVVVANKSSWSSRKDISKKNPDYIIKDLSKLVNIIRELNSEQLSLV